MFQLSGFSFKLSKHFAASYWPCGLARKASSRMPRNSLAATTSQRACPCHSFLGTARLLCLSCQSVDRWHVVQQIVKPSCAEHGAPIALVRNGSFGSKTSRPTWEFLKPRIPYFGVLIRRILLFRVLYSGPLFLELRGPVSFLLGRIGPARLQRSKTSLALAALVFISPVQ